MSRQSDIVLGLALAAYASGRNDLSEADLSRADLRGADLIGADLRGANLRRANLIGADLIGADLRGADLRGADLSRANLIGADLIGADLRGADLRGADLSGADLRGADLSEADLSRADLSRANLSRADLSGADLSGARHDAGTLWPAFQIVQEGPLTVYKKLKHRVIARLLVPAKAKRTASLVGRKCRAEYVKVLAITGPDGAALTTGYAAHDGTSYQVGAIVRPDAYDPSPLVECTNGIHFFQTKAEAEAY